MSALRPWRHPLRGGDRGEEAADGGEKRLRLLSMIARSVASVSATWSGQKWTAPAYGCMCRLSPGQCVMRPMSIPKEVELLIEKSGNTFHAKVARWFKENGWHVAVSPYYMDQTQVKAREIDLIAERLWPAFDQYGKPSGHIAVQLFIECKYIPSYSVIWLAERDMKKAEKIVDRAIPLKFSFAAGHHYLSERAVAKLFASQRGGKAQHEPRSGEDDPLYKAVNQVLNGMVSLRGRPARIQIPIKKA